MQLHDCVYHVAIHVGKCFRDDHSKRMSDISYREYRQRLLSEQTTEAHLVWYYGRAHDSAAGLVILDTFYLIDLRSPRTGRCLADDSGAGDDVKGDVGILFYKNDLHFLGQVMRDDTRNVIGRKFKAGDRIEFTLSWQSPTDEATDDIQLCTDLRDQYKGYLAAPSSESEQQKQQKAADDTRTLLLRRRYYSAADVWNQRARVWINDRDYGTWFTPMGTFNDLYSLRESDLQIREDDVRAIMRSGRVSVIIEPQCDWYDVEYELIAIL